MIMKRRPNLTSRSKYGVSNESHFTDKLTFNMNATCEFHYRDGYRVLATHFYYKGYDTSGFILNRFR